MNGPFSDNKYLGQFPIAQDLTPYAGFTRIDWALRFIQRYGGIGGEHHKAWVLDQCARIMHGTPVKVEIARWDVSANHPDGHEEYRFWTEKPSHAYLEWVAECRDGEDGPETYDYDEGIAP